MEFVSLPVVSGFTSAAALTIASSQIKGLLGLKYNAETFIGTWKGLFEHITETRLTDSLLSAGCCITLLGMQVIIVIVLLVCGRFATKVFSSKQTLVSLYICLSMCTYSVSENNLGFACISLKSRLLWVKWQITCLLR